MTGGIVLTGGCYLVTAAGLTGIRASARALLIVAGTAGLGIAASPEPARGATPRHLAWTVFGAVTIAVWPAFAARRASSRPRSEERRVGKECRSRGPRERYRKDKDVVAEPGEERP